MRKLGWLCLVSLCLFPLISSHHSGQTARAADPVDAKATAAESKPATPDAETGKNWITQKVTIPPTVAVDPTNSDSKKADSGPADAFHVPPGFKVEHLFEVPKNTLGSWVSMCLDNKGRLIVSDQNDKGLCRITPPPVGTDGPCKVEHLDVKMSQAQGMLYAFDSLYVVVNAPPPSRNSGTVDRSGLYRLRDTKGNDQFDEVVKLKDFYGPKGEHGPHAIRLSPDGKSLFIVCGNHTETPFTVAEMKTHPEFRSYEPPVWDEDLILPRIWDPNGHARGRMAPGGYVVQTDPDGKSWTFYSTGYRNVYDMDFNADGELFTYDSDMEWDMGTPWYRPTRILHASQGSDFGWRSGAGVWPWYYADSLAPIADVGPGSPVGVTFGYGAKFPAKYQKCLFACDWTFGTMYAILVEPEGSSYKAVKEEFLSRNGLPLTDVVIGNDGAMYLTIGGRNTQSDLFRVTYVGSESTAPVDAKDTVGKDLRDLRHKIEAYQLKAADDPAKAVEFLVPHLGHADRLIRYAARTALEFQPEKLWQDRVLAATNPDAVIEGAIAVAHEADKSDKSVGPKVIAALDRLDFDKLSTMQQLGVLRGYELAIIRLGEPTGEARTALIKRLDGRFPGQNDLVNRELCNLLSALQSPTIVAKTIKLLEQASPPPSEEFGQLLQRNRQYARPIEAMMEHHPDKQKIQYAYAIRNVKDGWTVDQRKVFFKFLRDAAQWSGGHSFAGFLKQIDADAFANASEKERLMIEATGMRKPFVVPPLPKPEGPGHDWTMDEVVTLGETKLKDRDFNNGKKMFAAARCIVCHRFGADGGATGPDLTLLAGRFKLKDLTESIIDPNKVIAQQYQNTVYTVNGKTYIGRNIGESTDKIYVATDPEDSTKLVELKKSDIEDSAPSSTSWMPAGLLKPLNETEVLDLMAYLLSRGNEKDAMFTQKK